ncbi:chemotaxis protein CheW [Erythrobacter sp. LQ02-29]|uniref:chemotaxis protein CheW n=1 Tax=unclassified Erythrobacter TaxID=2633097 RepID=UPI001BFC31C3|nr:MULTISPECIES: chemotaxis protein CheW [unclassified Erythrobacter]MCP9222815.1 chemotaxis protein CheW [Erythrobacter sp. LQ02-29]QWC55979.1 chemotaxis protein CheW [Erythrobacter sp. 3-20A1M]
MNRQLITFQINGQTLGMDIMAIREIRAWSPATPLPNVDSHVRGVVNLRGVVLPVLDLRERLGWGRTEPSERHVIIVMSINEQLHGIMADAVNDIVSVSQDDLQPPPEVDDPQSPSLLEALATVDDRVISVLALERLSLPKALSEAA